MTDKELLALAAKAAGMPVDKKDGLVWCDNVGPNKESGLWFDASLPSRVNPNPRFLPRTWNPLTNDGDAQRLAVTCKIDTNHGYNMVVAEPVYIEEIGVAELHGDDPRAATRRAIVLAAAEIGKAMK